MKRILLASVLSLVLLSCGSKTPELEFTTQVFKTPACENCAQVDVSVVVPIGEHPPFKKIRNHILYDAVTFLKTEENMSEKDTILSEGAAFFEAERRELLEDFPDAIPSWQASYQAKVTMQTPQLVSLKVEGYHYGGGAHGMSVSYFLNFDLNTGDILSVEEWVKDPVAFTSAAEQWFRNAQRIPMGHNINSTGFMFMDDRFILPSGLGFTQNGLQFIYNPYEIATYVEGSTLMEVPYELAQEFLKEEYRPDTTRDSDIF